MRHTHTQGDGDLRNVLNTYMWLHDGMKRYLILPHNFGWVGIAKYQYPFTCMVAMFLHPARVQLKLHNCPRILRLVLCKLSNHWPGALFSDSHAYLDSCLATVVSYHPTDSVVSVVLLGHLVIRTSQITTHLLDCMSGHSPPSITSQYIFAFYGMWLI